MMTKGPIIKIAPTKEEQKAQKKREKHLDLFRVEEIDPKTKIFISERNKDQFFNGPLDMWICDHQPNGPRGSEDPNGYWADYFIKDTVNHPDIDMKVTGFHIYSTFHADSYFDVKADKLGMDEAPTGLGSRTVRMRKCYYYVGFISESVLAIDGLELDQFTSSLTMG